MNRKRLNQTSLLVMVLAAVAILVAWSLISQPTATLIASLPYQDRYEYRLAGEEDKGTSWWHLRCFFEGTSVPMSISADDGQGQGHQLQWDPNSLYWRLTRLGSGPGLLAQGRLESLPRRMSLFRHGHRLELRADGQVLTTVVDLAASPPAQRWSLSSEHPQSAMRLEIHDHIYLSPGSASESEVLEVLEATLAHFRERSKDDYTLFEQANNLIAHFQEPPYNKTRLYCWLMWAYGRGMLSSGNHSDPSALDVVVAYLRDAAEREQPPPEIPGLLMDLQRRTAERAAIIPEDPVRAQDFVQRRSKLLRSYVHMSEVITALAERSGAAEHGHLLSSNDRFLLFFGAQLARALSGLDVASTPAEAPAWLSVRVRILGGRLPIEVPLPEIERDWFQRDWLRPGVEHLLQLASGLDQGPSHRLRSQILGAQREGSSADEITAMLNHAEVDTRLRVVSTGIMAVQGMLPVSAGLEALGLRDSDGVSLIERDPLAYAVYRLLLHRRGHEREGEVGRAAWALPPGLTPYAQLLDGGYGATIIAFSRPGGTIPPSEALASALAMQEVSGIRPQWELLESLPSMTLPLSLLIPPPPQPVPTFSSP